MITNLRDSSNKKLGGGLLSIVKLLWKMGQKLSLDTGRVQTAYNKKFKKKIEHMFNIYDLNMLKSLPNKYDKLEKKENPKNNPNDPPTEPM